MFRWQLHCWQASEIGWAKSARMVIHSRRGYGTSSLVLQTFSPQRLSLEVLLVLQAMDKRWGGLQPTNAEVRRPGPGHEATVPVAISRLCKTRDWHAISGFRECTVQS